MQPRPIQHPGPVDGSRIDALPVHLRQVELVLRIPQPGGEESLNVAAAAAVCLYESMRRGGPP